MLNCRDTTRLLSESQERKLSIKEKTSMRLHMLMCRNCRNCQQSMATLRLAARAYTEGADERGEE